MSDANKWQTTLASVGDLTEQAATDAGKQLLATMFPAVVDAMVDLALYEKNAHVRRQAGQFLVEQAIRLQVVDPADKLKAFMEEVERVANANEQRP